MKKSVIALLLACALGGGSFAGTASAQSQSAKEKAAARDKESAKAWVELYPEIEKAIQAPTFRDKDYPIFKYGKNLIPKVTYIQNSSTRLLTAVPRKAEAVW